LFPKKGKCLPLTEESPSPNSIKGKKSLKARGPPFKRGGGGPELVQHPSFSFNHFQGFLRSDFSLREVLGKMLAREEGGVRLTPLNERGEEENLVKQPSVVPEKGKADLHSKNKKKPN